MKISECPLSVMEPNYRAQKEGLTVEDYSTHDNVNRADNVIQTAGPTSIRPTIDVRMKPVVLDGLVRRLLKREEIGGKQQHLKGYAYEQTYPRRRLWRAESTVGKKVRYVYRENTGNEAA